MQTKTNKKCPKCNRHLYTSLMSPDEIVYSCLYCNFKKVIKIKGLVNVDYNIFQERSK